MEVLSPSLIVLMGLSLCTYWNVQSKNRKIIFGLTNLIFLALILEPVSFFCILAIAAIGYLFSKIAEKWCFLTSTLIVFWIAIYVSTAGYLFQFTSNAMFNMPTIVGVSYILFRVLEILIKHKNGFRSLSIGDYSIYILNFLTILSGPIQRVEQFKRQLGIIQNGKFEDVECLDAFHRIFVGLVKVFLLASIVNLEHQTILSVFIETHNWEPIRMAILSFAYLVFLYLNFSGYMDIVIGIGKLYGLELPENFNNPFLAKSFIDFWERWHITLSSWMKCYVYTPLLARMLRISTKSTAVFGFSILTYFITFLLIGIWHGTSMSFIYCGFMLAFAACLSQLIQQTKHKLLKKKNGVVSSTILYVMERVFSSLSLAHISISIIGFWLTWEQILLIKSNISLTYFIKIYSVGAFLCFLLFLLTKLLNFATSTKLYQLSRVREITIALNVFLFFLGVYEFGDSTEGFVYQGF